MRMYQIYIEHRCLCVCDQLIQIKDFHLLIAAWCHASIFFNIPITYFACFNWPIPYTLYLPRGIFSVIIWAPNPLTHSSNVKSILRVPDIVPMMLLYSLLWWTELPTQKNWSNCFVQQPTKSHTPIGFYTVVAEWNTVKPIRNNVLAHNCSQLGIFFLWPSLRHQHSAQ